MGIVGGTPRHYTGKGLGDQPVGSPTQWKCPTCGTVNISVQTDGCPSCGAGTQAQADVAAAQAKEASLPPDQVARIVFGLAEVGADELTGWARCLRAPAQLTLCRALAHYAETGAPTAEELTRAEIISWGRAVMPVEE